MVLYIRPDLYLRPYLCLRSLPAHVTGPEWRSEGLSLLVLRFGLGRSVNHCHS